MKDRVRQFLARFLNRRFLARFKRYLVVGFVSFGLEYGLFLLLLRPDGGNYLSANIIVYSIIFWFNYLANRLWTFQSKLPILRQLPLYAALFVFNLIAVNIGLIYLLTTVAGVPARLSKILVMGAVVSWNYILYQTVIYRR